jgi:hypothetical protein
MLRRAALLAAVILFTGCLHTNTVPPPAPGADGPRLEAAYQPPFYTGPGNVGAFRTECELSFTAPVDPIVYPGQGDLDAGPSHDHNFFGPTWHDGFTTDPTGAPASTCYGGTLNRTAYWAPAMIDAATGTGSGMDSEYDMVQPATGAWTLPLQVYYKSGYGGVASLEVEQFPPGLRIIAGDKNSTAPQEHVLFDCITSGDATSYYSPSGGGPSAPDVIRNRSSIPTDCPAGRIIQVRITFPPCWDGDNLDSPDHKSHMAYPTLAEGCPSSHPVPLTEIIEHLRYRVGPGGATYYRFVTDLYDLTLPAGYTFHADWWFGWDMPTFDAIVNDCVAAEHDCRMNLVGFTGDALAYPTTSTARSAVTVDKPSWWLREG